MKRLEESAAIFQTRIKRREFIAENNSLFIKIKEKPQQLNYDFYRIDLCVFQAPTSCIQLNCKLNSRLSANERGSYMTWIFQTRESYGNHPEWIDQRHSNQEIHDLSIRTASWKSSGLGRWNTGALLDICHLIINRSRIMRGGSINPQLRFISIEHQWNWQWTIHVLNKNTQWNVFWRHPVNDGNIDSILFIFHSFFFWSGIGTSGIWPRQIGLRTIWHVPRHYWVTHFSPEKSRKKRTMKTQLTTTKKENIREPKKHLYKPRKIFKPSPSTIHEAERKFLTN